MAIPPVNLNVDPRGFAGPFRTDLKVGSAQGSGLYDLLTEAALLRQAMMRERLAQAAQDRMLQKRAFEINRRNQRADRRAARVGSRQMEPTARAPRREPNYGEFAQALIGGPGTAHGMRHPGEARRLAAILRFIGPQAAHRGLMQSGRLLSSQGSRGVYEGAPQETPGYGYAYGDVDAPVPGMSAAPPRRRTSTRGQKLGSLPRPEWAYGTNPLFTNRSMEERGYEHGSIPGRVPKTEKARVHKGEIIVPAEQADDALLNFLREDQERKIRLGLMEPPGYPRPGEYQRGSQVPRLIDRIRGLGGVKVDPLLEAEYEQSGLTPSRIRRRGGKGLSAERMIQALREEGFVLPDELDEAGLYELAGDSYEAKRVGRPEPTMVGTGDEFADEAADVFRQADEPDFGAEFEPERYEAESRREAMERRIREQRSGIRQPPDANPPGAVVEPEELTPRMGEEGRFQRRPVRTFEDPTTQRLHDASQANLREVERMNTELPEAELGRRGLQGTEAAALERQAAREVARQGIPPERALVPTHAGPGVRSRLPSSGEVFEMGVGGPPPSTGALERREVYRGLAKRSENDLVKLADDVGRDPKLARRMLKYGKWALAMYLAGYAVKEILEHAGEADPEAEAAGDIIEGPPSEEGEVVEGEILAEDLPATGGEFRGSGASGEFQENPKTPREYGELTREMLGTSLGYITEPAGNILDFLGGVTGIGGDPTAEAADLPTEGGGGEDLEVQQEGLPPRDVLDQYVDFAEQGLEEAERGARETDVTSQDYRDSEQRRLDAQHHRRRADRTLQYLSRNADDMDPQTYQALLQKAQRDDQLADKLEAQEEKRTKRLQDRVEKAQDVLVSAEEARAAGNIDREKATFETIQSSLQDLEKSFSDIEQQLIEDEVEPGSDAWETAMSVLARIQMESDRLQGARTTLPQARAHVEQMLLGEY